MSNADARRPSPEALDLRAVPRDVWTLVPERLLRARRVLPVEVVRGAGRVRLRLATAAPSDLAVLDELAFVTGFLIEPVTVEGGALEQALAFHLDGVALANAASPRMAIELDGGGSAEPLPDDWLVPLATDDGKW